MKCLLDGNGDKNKSKGGGVDTVACPYKSVQQTPGSGLIWPRRINAFDGEGRFCAAFGLGVVFISPREASMGLSGLYRRYLQKIPE